MDADKRQRRDLLQSSLDVAYREADKIIVGVSGTVLAFSVAFVPQIAEPKALVALQLGWAALLLVIMLVVVSLLFEQADKRVLIARLTRDEQEGVGPHDRRINQLNITAVALFFVGTFLMGIFMLANVNGGSTA